MQQPQEPSKWQYTPGAVQQPTDPQASIPPTSSPAPSVPPAEPTQSPPLPVPQSTEAGIISWTASEYVHHERGAGWYGMLLLLTILITAGVYFVTRDYFASGTIVALGIIVGIYAGRKPNQVTYELTNTGIKVGDKTYNYSSFKSFSTINQDGLNSINLIPIKRYMPPVSAYYAETDEDKITSAIGDHLPYEERKPDAIDRLSHRLRF